MVRELIQIHLEAVRVGDILLRDANLRCSHVVRKVLVGIARSRQQLKYSTFPNSVFFIPEMNQ